MSLALEPLAPIQQVNFPSDRDYTHNALIEELVLIERHLRDESWRLCNCNPEKHLPAIAALGSEGQGFAETDEEREFMRKLQARARIWKDKIKKGTFTDADANNLRALVREYRHRIEFKQWVGEMSEAPELEDVAVALNHLSLAGIEEKHVDDIVTNLSKKWGIKKPKVRFINNCNPMKDAYQVGRDLVIKDKHGEIERFPLTDLDEIIICRGGGSAYAVTHEACHFKDRVEKGYTSEDSATKCALDEVGNTIFTEKTLNRLTLEIGSGGNMSVVKARPLADFIPLTVGLVAGEMVDEMGLIESTVGPYAGTLTPLVKVGIGAASMWLGTSKAKGYATDFMVGLGLPIIVSGIKEFIAPVAPVAARAGVVRAYPTQYGYPGGLTPYTTPTGLYGGHPTLRVPKIPPRPGILAPPQMTMYSHMQEPALSGKYILGGR